MKKFLSLGFIFIFLAGMVAASFARADQSVFEPLNIVTVKGETHSFRVEIARTPLEQMVGLMYREDMEEDAGMLFLFSTPRLAAFWMKNTLIPLDMLFIDAEGRIVNIHENVPPLSLEQRPSNGPVMAVLELLGGTTARLGIAAGDKIEHKAFKNK